MCWCLCDILVEFCQRRRLHSFSSNAGRQIATAHNRPISLHHKKLCRMRATRQCLDNVAFISSSIFFCQKVDRSSLNFSFGRNQRHQQRGRQSQLPVLYARLHQKRASLCARDQSRDDSTFDPAVELTYTSSLYSCNMASIELSSSVAFQAASIAILLHAYLQ